MQKHGGQQRGENLKSICRQVSMSRYLLRSSISTDENHGVDRHGDDQAWVTQLIDPLGHKTMLSNNQSAIERGKPKRDKQKGSHIDRDDRASDQRKTAGGIIVVEWE